MRLLVIMRHNSLRQPTCRNPSAWTTQRPAARIGRDQRRNPGKQSPVDHVATAIGHHRHPFRAAANPRRMSSAGDASRRPRRVTCRAQSNRPSAGEETKVTITRPDRPAGGGSASSTLPSRYTPSMEFSIDSPPRLSHYTAQSDGFASLGDRWPRHPRTAVRGRLSLIPHPSSLDPAHFVCSSLSNAASKATRLGSKSSLRTNSRASLAPRSRSMPLSSHSTESGPV